MYYSLIFPTPFYFRCISALAIKTSRNALCYNIDIFYEDQTDPHT